MIWKEGMSMCDRAPENNAIRRAMDACLPRLENEADFERMVLKQVRGAIKVKKKLSVGFVLVIVLALAAVTATLATTQKKLLKTFRERRALLLMALSAPRRWKSFMKYISSKPIVF